MSWLKLKTFFAKLSTLQLALGTSILVHVVLLTVRFVNPVAFNRIFKDTPLEVVLVNAKSTPTQDSSAAQVIAQHQLNGGGDASKGIASTPLPMMHITKLGLNAEQTQAKLEQLQAQQQRMLVQIKQQLAHMAQSDPKPMGRTEKAEQALKQRQLLNILGTIEKRINEENARPKKRFIGPSTREESYAIYYDDLRRKIEQRGTQDFPQASGQKLYGDLTMMLTINSEGRVLGTPEVVESSGNKQLDRRAIAIASQAGPFGKFNAAMREGADQLVVISRFKFTRESALEAEVMSPN